MKFQKNNGVIVPVERPAPKPPIEQFIQRDLHQSQLGRYLSGLDEAGASINAVFANPNGIFARFSVVYQHTESLECEIYC